MNTPVIYKISSLISDKIYVESAVNFKKRHNRHISDLNLKRHNSPKLQCFVNKHGIECLIFSIIENVEDRELLIEREQFYIDTLKPWFNIRLIANSPKGLKASDETKRKMSIAQTGKKRNFLPEHIASLIERNKSKIWSDEAKLKISNANVGRIKSEDVRKNHSKKMKGRKLSPEHAAKIGKANIGRPISQKTRDAVAEQNRNRVVSDETRNKLSESGKIRWQKFNLNK